MKLLLILAYSSALLSIEAIGSDRINSDSDQQLTVPIFRETSRDYLSPVFYQLTNKNNRSRRQVYNPYQPRYSTPRPWLWFGADQDAFLRRRHRGGGGFPRRDRGRLGRRPVFLRPVRGGYLRGRGLRGGFLRGGRGGGGRGRAVIARGRG